MKSSSFRRQALHTPYMSATGPRRLNSETVVSSAISIADREGADALTLARLAGQLSIRPPSLYTHVSNLQDLQGRIAEKVTAMLIETLRDATIGRSGKAALRNLAYAYREFAKAHPGVYPGIFSVSVGREPDQALVRCLAQALCPDVAEDEKLIFARIVLSALHGFVSLEFAGQLGSEDDKDFDRLLKALWKAMP